MEQQQAKMDRIQVYEGPQERGHIAGAWYFCPVGWDVTSWAFSQPHETEAMAKVSAGAWAARFERVQ